MDQCFSCTVFLFYGSGHYVYKWKWWKKEKEINTDVCQTICERGFIVSKQTKQNFNTEILTYKFSHSTYVFTATKNNSFLKEKNNNKNIKNHNYQKKVDFATFMRALNFIDILANFFSSGPDWV